MIGHTSPKKIGYDAMSRQYFIGEMTFSRAECVILAKGISLYLPKIGRHVEANLSITNKHLDPHDNNNLIRIWRDGNESVGLTASECKNFLTLYQVFGNETP